MDTPTVVAVERNAWDTADISTIKFENGHYETVVFPDNGAYRTHYTQQRPEWSFSESEAEIVRHTLKTSPLEDKSR